MEIINIAKGVDVITEGYIPLNSQSIRETVNSIVTSDQLYVANRRRIRAQRRYNNRPVLSRIVTVISSL